VVRGRYDVEKRLKVTFRVKAPTGENTSIHGEIVGDTYEGEMTGRRRVKKSI